MTVSNQYVLTVPVERLEGLRDAKRLSWISVGHCSFQPILAATLTERLTSNWE